MSTERTPQGEEDSQEILKPRAVGEAVGMQGSKRGAECQLLSDLQQDSLPVSELLSSCLKGES